MPPTRCQVNSMPKYIVKPSNCCLLVVSALSLPGIESAASSWRHRVDGIELTASSWRHQVGPFHLRISWNAKSSTNLEKEVKTAMQSWYVSVNTRLVFTSKHMLPVVRKNALPTTQVNFVIHEYKCLCHSLYVGRTSQRLQDRIKQHVPTWLWQHLTRPRIFQPDKFCKQNSTKPDRDPVLVGHLSEDEQSALDYESKRFSISATARTFFYLKSIRGTICQGSAPGVLQTGRVHLQS